MRPLNFVPPLLVALLITFLAPTSNGQKLARKFREFPAIGIKFKPLDDFTDVPVNERLASLGIVGQLDALRGPYIKFEDGERRQYDPGLKVLHIKAVGPSTAGGDEREQKKDKRHTAKDFVEDLYSASVSGLELEGEEDEVKATKEYIAQRVEFQLLAKMNYTDGMHRLDRVFDVYTFSHGLDKVIFIWDYPGDKKERMKWEKAVVKSMKSFRPMEEGSATSGLTNINSDSSYEDLLEFHQENVAQTPGWRLVETPSKQYLIKTNSDDDKDIKEVIARLEASRRLYEEDFPPATPITSVSVVRLCGTRADFNTYGQTSGGVAGYFNPGSEELVLFFGESGKSMTLSVMAHEGFHQYCHFLFGRAEAHRWFDEGHGDYYGAWRLKGKKLVQQEDMKGGLARMPELKTMFRNDDIKALSKHIRADHSTWQNQGPSNVSCYAQSFGLIYFLRQGAKRKISAKYWKKEYATIIPNYMAALNQGFQDAFEEVRKEAQEKLDQIAKQDPDDVDLDLKESAESRIREPWKYARGHKEEIWEKSMAASWGQIDEAAFEKRWLLWVDKGM
jgi:hypothetical protein